MAGVLLATIFKCSFTNENDHISIKVSLAFDLMVPANNKSALVQVMARRQAIAWTNVMMTQFSDTVLCIIRPQWVNPWSASPISIWDLHYAIDDSTAVLSPYDAGPSVGARLTTGINQLDPNEHILIKCYFYSRKCIWKCRLQNSGHLVSISVC